MVSKNSAWHSVCFATCERRRRRRRTRTRRRTRRRSTTTTSETVSNLFLALTLREPRKQLHSHNVVLFLCPRQQHLPHPMSNRCDFSFLLSFFFDWVEKCLWLIQRSFFCALHGDQWEIDLGWTLSREEGEDGLWKVNEKRRYAWCWDGDGQCRMGGMMSKNSR